MIPNKIQACQAIINRPFLFEKKLKFQYTKTIFMTLSSAIFDFSKIIFGLVTDIIYFPIWWYTAGFVRILQWSKKYLHDRLQANGLMVWLKNIFTPMYGQTDWAGVLISFLTRCLQIIFRSLAMLFWLLVVIILNLVWLAVPIIVVNQLIFQVISFFQT